MAEERAAAEPATLGVLELEALEPVMLEHERAAPPVIRDVRAWAFGEGGGFDVIRDEEGQGRFSLVEVDGEGGRVRERSLDPLPEDVGRVLWTRLATRDWLAIWSGFGQGATSRLFRVDRATGTADELEGLDCPAVEAVAATADGGFVLLATHHYRHSMEKVVLAYDATPTLRWSRGEDREDPAGLSFPKDVAVTSDGRVLVLETVRKTIQEYADNGAHLGTLDLRQALGREPNYPAGISAGPDGSVLLDDFHGEPPLWQLDARGAVRGSWSPRFADGRPVEPRTVHFDADGALWGCDGYSFLQLDGEGLVQRVVGQPLAAEEILETGAATIDELGRPCVQDRRTGNVHVWGPDGRKRFLALLPPGGTDLPVRLGRISAGARGELQLGRYRWDASGRLLGQVDPRAPILDPRTGGYWVRTGGHWARKEPVGLRLLDSNGEEIATLDRRPDGSWFKDIRDVATGPAGQLAVLDAPYLFLFSAEREPLRTFELPDSVSGPMQLRDVALGPSWAVLTGWGPSWLLLRLEDGTFFRFEPELTKSEGSQYEAALSADGRELRILAVHELRVLRFALSRG